MNDSKRASLVITCLLLAACESSTEPEPVPFVCTDEPCLAPPESGFQVHSVGHEIQAGEDVEYCEVVQLPGDPAQLYHVSRFEIMMTEFSHHLIIAAAEPGSETEQSMVPGDRIPCVTPDVFGSDILPVTGSQHPYHEETFPDGVGRAYPGGSKLVFDYHYFNTSAAPVKARAAVNFHVVPPEQIQKLARGFGFFNLGIEIPVGQTKAFEKSCAFDNDVTVFKVTRHTHQWGRDFDVWFDGGPRDGEHVWTSDDYENTDYTLSEPVVMQAGEGFRFRCEFENTSDHDLSFGVNATDEMCILFGGWYAVEGSGADLPGQGCFN